MPFEAILFSVLAASAGTIVLFINSENRKSERNSKLQKTEEEKEQDWLDNQW